jgi:hypothetical protein
MSFRFGRTYWLAFVGSIALFLIAESRATHTQAIRTGSWVKQEARYALVMGNNVYWLKGKPAKVGWLASLSAIVEGDRIHSVLNVVSDREPRPSSHGAAQLSTETDINSPASAEVSGLGENQ